MLLVIFRRNTNLSFNWYYLAYIAILSLTSLLASAEPLSTKINSNKHQVLTETTHIIGGSNNRVRRWSDDIRVSVVGPISKNTHQRLRKLLTQLSMYTGLQIKLLAHNYSVAEYSQAVFESPPYDLVVCNRNNPGECANFVIIVSSQIEMNHISRNFPLRPVFQKATANPQQVHCFFSPGIKNGIEIKRSVVFINRDLDEPMIQTCLQEEIIQSLGLFNDYSGSLYYSFNNIVSRKTLTTHDIMLLTSLYDRDFPLGSTGHSIALPVATYSEKHLHRRNIYIDTHRNLSGHP